ncbi:MAG TPA: tripartite tricarboxylate transporter substrate binding protein BugD, partial [Xanthobacteraceae bacterium]
MSRFIFAIALALGLGLAPASAQVYPSRQITMVVPFAAGGPSDVVARILVDRLRASLG